MTEQPCSPPLPWGGNCQLFAEKSDPSGGARLPAGVVPIRTPLTQPGRWRWGARGARGARGRFVPVWHGWEAALPPESSPTFIKRLLQGKV